MEDGKSRGLFQRRGAAAAAIVSYGSKEHTLQILTTLLYANVQAGGLDSRANVQATAQIYMRDPTD
uniref:Uncharacterized protein n=1 Tax=Oryza barthii TaxID=65489 RepID=A0A0D3G0G5_9ORYZ